MNAIPVSDLRANLMKILKKTNMALLLTLHQEEKLLPNLFHLMTLKKLREKN